MAVEEHEILFHDSPKLCNLLFKYLFISGVLFLRGCYFPKICDGCGWHLVDNVSCSFLALDRSSSCSYRHQLVGYIT